MSDEQEQQQTQEPEKVEIDLGVLAYLGQDNRGLLDRVDEGDLDENAPEIEEALRKVGITATIRMADQLKADREAEAEAAQKRAEEEAARLDEGLRAQLRREIEKDRAEQAEVERRERMKRELIEGDERKARGQEGPDPQEVAAARLGEITEKLGDRTLSMEDRQNLWAEAGELEDVLQPEPEIQDVNPDDFRARLKERIERG